MRLRCLIVWLLVAAGSHLPLPARAADVQFNRDIRPIFNQHCVECHGGVKQAGGLSFAYEAKILDVLEPGKPDESFILDRLMADDEDRMPPAEHGPPLPVEKIQLIREWIAAGAKFERHWAFDPPRPADALPVVSDANWPKSRIDHFILHGLDSAGLKPSPAAEPDRWQRRVSLDLIGLPPNPDERSAFLKDLSEQGEAAYAREVDRLLASPHFGERWASVWLDLVRYADSRGLGQDGRRNMWKYRDWVIDAFNADLPYDQFTIKQIAGDLLPNPTLEDLIATAGQRLTQTNEEGGTDDEQFRIEAVIDRVNTTWMVWNGLTMGCVQCHSHPYEPIPHADYYRFAAYFNNTADTDITNDDPRIQVPLNPEEYSQAMDLDRRIADIRLKDWSAGNAFLQDADRWQPLREMQGSTNNETRVEVHELDEGSEYVTVGTVARSTEIRLESALPEGVTQLTAIRFTGFPLNPEQAVRDSEWGFVLSRFRAEWIGEDGTANPVNVAYVIADEPEPLSDPQSSIAARGRSGFGAYSRINLPHSAAFVLAEPLTLPPRATVRVSLRFDVIETGAFPLVAKRGRLAVSGDPAFTDWLRSEDHTRAVAELSELQNARRRLRSIDLPVMKERWPAFARPSFVFERGNYLTKGEQVTPAAPAFLQPAGEKPTRLDMARWMASAENPLTSRVMANRVWSQLFGVGLVETQEDFGSSGEPPVNQPLLDDLAVRFQTDMGWSVKTLLRELVLSSAYRQSSQVDPERLSKDPQNRLVSRGPRNRLPAETVRDQALAICGLFNGKLHGPPVFPPLPDGVWMPFQEADRWNTAAVGSGDRYRRTLYTYMKRTIPFPMMSSFDAPSREFCSARRLPSNTPLQALMLLNDEALHEAAQGLAKRMSGVEGSLEEKLAFGFLLATNRPAQPREVQLLRELYDRSLTLAAEPGAGDEKENSEADNVGRELVALTDVAATLLNLDEVLCK